MKTIELNILAEDFKNSFLDLDNCAISSALKRAGINATHGGMEIIYHNPKLYSDSILSPDALNLKVRQMYAHVEGSVDGWGDDVRILGTLEPQDFTFSIEVPDNW